MNRLFAGSVLLAALAAPGLAQARQAECLMIISGRTLIDGRCEFDSGSDGSFRMESDRFVGHVMVERPGAGSGTWTAKPEVRDAYRDTGPLRRNGACWESNTATYCAWGLGQRPQGQQFGQQGARAPSAPPQQFAQAVPPRATAAEACPPRGSARSVDSAQTAQVQFVNQTGVTLRLYWLDYKGERQHYADIQPNGQLNQQTYVSHPWILVDPQGGCVGGVFYARAGNQRHVLAGAASPAPSSGFAQPAPPRPQVQQAAPQAPSGTRVEAEPAAGGWRTLRYINNNTNVVTRCGVERNYSNGDMLRFTTVKRANGSLVITTHFASPRFNAAAMPERFEVRYWVDDENGTQRIIAVREGANGARFTETADGPGSEDGFANGKDLAIAIGQQVLSFPLKGSNPMIKALIDCGHSQLAAAQPQPQTQQPRPQVQQPAPQQQVEILTTWRFHAISNADLQKWNSSGCSFSALRGRDLVAIFDIQDQRKTALFKIDGRIVTVRFNGDRSAHWVGNVAGHEVRLIKGRVNPAFRNDGGGQGGAGRLEWRGPAGEGVIDIRWEEGC